MTFNDTQGQFATINVAGQRSVVPRTQFDTLTLAGAGIVAITTDPTTGTITITGTGNGVGTVTSMSVTTANGVSGTVATATTTPAVTLVLGAITPTTVNGVTVTTCSGTLTLANAKVFTASNTMTLTATDGSTLAIGGGGTLGTAAYTAANTYALLAGATFTGNVSFGAKTATFTETDNGNSSTADTIDWTAGNKQKSTLTGNCTFTFTPPAAPCSLVLKLVQDATGSRLVTWPAAVHWPAGTAPTLTTGANKVDLVSFYFDGTTFFGNSSLNFTA